jgi:hypothetical protein
MTDRGHACSHRCAGLLVARRSVLRYLSESAEATNSDPIFNHKPNKSSGGGMSQAMAAMMGGGARNEPTFTLSEDDKTMLLVQELLVKTKSELKLPAEHRMPGRSARGRQRTTAEAATDVERWVLALSCLLK